MSLPPLRSLIVLEAVVRLGGVGRAASELGVSQPAISQQLRIIENFFGRRMIERTSTGVSVDAEVELFAARLQRALDEVRHASAAFQEQTDGASNKLTISLLATFAQRWLIPRLIGFQNAQPKIDVRLMTTSAPTDLNRDDVDLSVRCGEGAWPGHDSQFLVDNRIFPIASPAYLENNNLRDADDLRQAVLIRVDTPPRDGDWTLWLDAVGAVGLEPRNWQTYATSTQALEAATAGLGVAMGHTPFVIDSLSSGRLVKPFEFELPDEDGDYFLVFKRNRDEPRRIRLFRNWLLNSDAM
ncbi:MAG: LysR family transcriptional regulator [Rhodospirillaceae bacterium]|jgi:LysR family glycine cleavage system transcriptional activator|nr:LysR family transcriptional regulator [Rhodospirillaceae bacterium]MBT5667235.1 LysR family transcriptional regulator [Rhodospirillaceae bacterium]